MLIKIDELNNELVNWYKNSTVKGINVVTVPYRGLDLLHPVLSYFKDGGRLLYITGEKKGLDQLSNLFKDFSNVPEIVDFNGALEVSNEYDLIIYDDVNSYPAHTKTEMHTLLTYLYKKTNKIIAYSIERVFKNVINLEHPVKADGLFIPEPRFLESRIDIKDSIPNSLYSYLEFFIGGKRKVIIVTSDTETKDGMIRYLLRINPQYAPFIIDADSVDEEEISEKGNDKEKPALIFTLNTGDFAGIKGNLEFVYINADLPKYEYRQFVFSALRSCSFGQPSGEVLMVAGSNTQNMEKAKELTREYNITHWENDDIFI